MKTKKALPADTKSLERLADGLIQASQNSRKSVSDKGFILTEDTYRGRLRHEVYPERGHPEEFLYRGCFGRAHANYDARPTNRRRYAIDAWQQDTWESFHNEA